MNTLPMPYLSVLMLQIKQRSKVEIEDIPVTGLCDTGGSHSLMQK